jgi:UDP-N-acetylmuramate dehydrogenase
VTGQTDLYEAFLIELRQQIASDADHPEWNEKILRDEPLHRYTVARLGGPADILVEIGSARYEQHLIKTIDLCQSYSLPLRVIGGGANLLFSDAGYRGVILLNTHRELKINAQTGEVVASAGVGLIQLARETMEAGLSGFEWAISVPGTVGGAAVNNAGAHGGEIAHNLHSALIYGESDGLRWWTKEELNYTYRESALKHAARRVVVITAKFQFTPGHDPAALRAKADEYAAHRKSTQPPGASLGSMFKNPPGDYAGRLIEAAGLKGHRVGGVVISPIHANFFVNTGGGTAHDYVELIRLAQRTVFNKFGVMLELEVELIGEF